MSTTFSCSAREKYVASTSYYCESPYCESLGNRESSRPVFSSPPRFALHAALVAALLILLGGCSQSRDSASDTSPPANTAQPARPADSGSATDSTTEILADESTDGLKVLVFGDSISAAYGIKRDDGWVALLAERIDHLYADAQVINASVSGETTQGGRARLAAALKRHAPNVVFLELGGNDALRGYPVERLRDNLSAMVELAQNHGARVVLLGMQIPPNYGPHYTREFAAAFKTVADAKDAYLVPFFLDGVALIEGMIQSDGIHPTTQAQPLLLETGWQALVATMGEAYPLLNSP